MLTPRLKSIQNNINTRKIADIGTDHAYIPIELARSGKIDKAIACDINVGPLQIAKINVDKYNLSNKIELRLGGGLNPINENEVDSIIIAGMGGQLITDILGDNINIAKSAKELILQPMNAQDVVRKFLIKNGFIISNEDLAIEGFKVYNIITTQKGISPTYTEIEYHIPKSLYSHEYFNQFIQKKHREFSKIVLGLKKASKLDADALSYYEPLLKDIENIKKTL